MSEPFDLITIGRISVDLYGQEIGHGLADPQSFLKGVGGSPTNVAIGAAKYGHRTAVVTGVGEDSFGDYLVSELQRYKVATDFVIRSSTSKTPANTTKKPTRKCSRLNRRFPA